MSKAKSKSKAKPVAKSAKPVKKAAPAGKAKASAKAVKKVVAKAKPVAKPVAKKVVKPVAKKAPVKAKAIVNKGALKAKPVSKKVVAKAKPVAKAVAKKVVAKAKPVVKAKPVAKAVAKKVAPKVAPKVVAPKAKAVVKPVLKPVAVKPVKIKTDKKKVKEDPIKQVKPSIEIMQKNELPKLSTIQTTHSFTKQKVQPAPSTIKELNADGSDKLRYTDKDLQEFKVLITDKIANAKAEYQLLHEQLNNAGDNGTDDTSGTFKMLEDGSETLAKEEAAQLAARQRKFIEQLESALIRIENKTYGICRVTGKLIPKERLKAVPHTTQSIEAKLLQNKEA